MAAKKAKNTGTRRSSARKSRTATQAPQPAEPVAFTREEALRTGAIPVIPGHQRTQAQLEAELASMPADFIRTKLPVRLLRREAEEMVAFSADVEVFVARGLGVSAGHFALIGTLAAMLPETRGEREESQLAYSGFNAKEDSEAGALRATVDKLGRLVAANGLSSSLTTLGDAEGNLRLMDAALGVVARVQRVKHQILPANEAEVLIQDIRTRVDGMVALRADQSAEASTATLSTDRIHRCKRLLLDTLRYVGNLGLYVFGDDPTRRAAYQLQHLNDYSNTRRRAPAPHNVVPGTPTTPVPG